MRRALAACLAAGLLLSFVCPARAEGKKRIALTFDDGPHPTHTEAILSLLDEYGITATFFVIGENISYFPDAFDKLVAADVEIGNHTYTHPKLNEQKEGELSDEIARCEEAIVARGGKHTSLFRPPEGVRNAVVTSVCRKAGYRTVYWNLDTLDWTGASALSIERAILSGVKNGSIILCHDYIASGGHTVEAMRRVIPRLLDQGYEFVTVSELLGIAN